MVIWSRLAAYIAPKGIICTNNTNNTALLNYAEKLDSFLLTFLFLATLVALHFTPVSESVSGSAEFRTSVAPRLASLLGFSVG